MSTTSTTSTTTSYKAEMLVGKEWCSNGCAFATREEAKRYGFELFQRWFAPSDYRVVESAEEPNYAIVDDEVVRLDAWPSTLEDHVSPRGPLGRAVKPYWS